MGGEFPHAEEELEHELVLLLCGTGGVPMENCTFGGDIDIMSGAGLELGGADTLRDLLDGNCLLGERGEDTGDDMEVALGLLRRAGLGAEQPWPLGTASSSGRGPRVDPPLAELTPLIADTLFRSSFPPLELIREFWIAAYAALCVGTGMGSVLWALLITGREPGRAPIRLAVRGDTPVFLFLELSPAKLFGTITKSASWSVSGLDPGDCLF